jgi:signal transduction histidine kinase
MRRRWIPWAVLALLAASCCVLAILQYTWLTQFASAQREQFRQDLQNRLSLLSRSFNDEISNSVQALTPSDSRIEELGREPAYAARYESWKASHEPIFRRIALAIPDHDDVILRMLDLNTARFSTADWPQEWSLLRSRMRARLQGGAPPGDSRNPSLFEIPRFGDGGEQEWLVLELNINAVRSSLLPEMLRKYVGDFDAEVTLASDANDVIFKTGAAHIAGREDASIALLEDQMRRGGPGREMRPPPRPMSEGPRGPGGPRNQPGRWRLYVQHRAGSLEAVVARTRSRNLAVAGALLVLIVAAVLVLMRVSRQAQRLADLQMNFVAGVSHELRTPLSVIRTAAYNLRGKMSHRPEQVERYGALIEDETTKLNRMVEQILRFASSQAGHAIRDRQPAAIQSIVEDALASAAQQIEDAGVVVETSIEPASILADASAMKHALQNLIENALKYAAEARWIGVSSSLTGDAVEIRVADRGPGIPPDELAHIFDPFYRGRTAIADQIHGTGLGLSLVKKIAEAHGGTISVASEPGKGTEFTLRIPRAQQKPTHEFAHSTD